MAASCIGRGPAACYWWKRPPGPGRSRRARGWELTPAPGASPAVMWVYMPQATADEVAAEEEWRAVEPGVSQVGRRVVRGVDGRRHEVGLGRLFRHLLLDPSGAIGRQAGNPAHALLAASDSDRGVELAAARSGRSGGQRRHWRNDGPGTTAEDGNSEKAQSARFAAARKILPSPSNQVSGHAVLRHRNLRRSLYGRAPLRIDVKGASARPRHVPAGGALRRAWQAPRRHSPLRDLQ